MVNVLSSRVLLHPTDLERTRAFYRDGLGLAIYREYGTGSQRGTVFFLGGGFLEVTGGSPEPPAPGLELWLQVADAEAVHRELAERGIEVLGPPTRQPWGLIEMWLTDPDGVRIVIVETPEDHPLRYRP
ncbi:glyoxalase [Wenjunlia vitaminophila]|uniref:Glyoxalase n=1 Tax=Wenjunlia vitaminophila TaxID=76728 RepID=A0A0T6LQR4_WENVI|nr:VOC family protein [Wenjunlia vitaminophila]KRV48281.1 glyoxalase [Wenjunlia vitaminophila]